jgi:two-component system response regulator HupR/HoxA
MRKVACIDNATGAGHQSAVDRATRLLFVDDEQLLLRAVRRYLEKHADELRLDARYARSADEALRILEVDAIDVIATDFRMPGKTGVDLLTEAARRWPRVARMLMSGEIEAPPGCAGVVDAFLAKPFELADFATVVKRLAGRT